LKILKIDSENSQARLIGGNSDEVYKIERCLQHVEAKVCDFDGMLTSGEQMQIDSALSDLEYATASRVKTYYLVSMQNK
jgi:hypothetical protein